MSPVIRSVLILSAVLLLLVGIQQLVPLIAPVSLEEMSPWEKKAHVERPASMAALRNAPNTLSEWPPVEGRPFPKVSFFSHDGTPFDLARYRGTPVFIELVAMTCAGCQAFAGGNEKGGFQQFAVQKNLQSIETYFKRYSGIELFDKRLLFVQVVVYNLELKPPSANDLSLWRDHFGFGEHQNTHIVSGGAALANQASYERIPGFLLLDADHIVRFDSTGHRPIRNLYTELLPAVPSILSKAKKK